MTQFMWFLLTITAALAGGFLFRKLKVPAGPLVGALLFAGVMLSVGWDLTALGEKTETVTWEITEPFRNITIRSDTEEILYNNMICTCVLAGSN